MTTPESLSGQGVLVTRPQDQAEPLCHLIEAAGGRALRLPGIAIRPTQDPAEAARLLAADWDLLIFVSRNAVEHGLPLFPAGRLPAAATVAAVGRATALALAAAGRTPDLVPEQRYDSEALLELPALQQLDAKRILIVRGNGGRPLLGDRLRAQRALVCYAEVYRRKPPRINAAHWTGRLRNEIDLVTATSTEILRNLHHAFDEPGRTLLLAKPLVVVGPRIAAAAEDLGFKRVITTKRADDQSILKALSQSAR